jgi:Ca-activated chloride channel family protein
MSIHFSQPIWLIAGSLICLLLMFYLRMAATKRHRALTRFVAPKMGRKLTANVSGFRRRTKTVLFLLAFVACFFTLAGPQYGEQWIEVKQKGIDILFGLDTSRSMLAGDIQPNRLQRAKLAIKDFVALLDGDRVGLMPFAGTSFLMCPLTTDYAAFTASLDAVTPASIPMGGTNLAEVITKAGKTLADEANHKILILVTDGEDLQGQALQSAEEAARQKMTIYTVGVGTKAGELIPDTGNGSGFLKNKAGNFIRSRLDEQTLKKIAEITHGIYVPLGNIGQGFTTIYQQKLKLVPKEEHQERKQRQPIERFYWPLAVALLLLLAEFLLSGRKSSWSFGMPFIKTAGRRLFNHRKLLIVFFLLIICPKGANGSTAEQLYHEGKLDQAEKKYAKALKKHPTPTLLFNLGNVQYKKNGYKEAIESFTKALATDDLTLQAKTYYNLGNAWYQQGTSTMATDPELTIDQYKKAVAAYEASLKLAPGDTDAKENLDVVKKQLQKLEQQKKKKQQDNTDRQTKNNRDSGKKKNQEKNTKSDGQQNLDNQQQKPEGLNTGNEKQSESKQPSEKADQEKKQKTKKNTPGDNSQKDKTGNSSSSGANEPAQARKTKGRAQGMSKEDVKRRSQGKMTRAEAAALLDALKHEEGRLEYIPAPGSSQKQAPGKDW